MLSHYFINTQLTLGSDFFGYDSQEIENTIKSSGEYSLADTLMYLLPFTSFLLFQRILRFKEFSLGKSLGILGGMLTLIIGATFCAPQGGSTTDAWSKNKSLAFYSAAFDHYTAQLQPQAPIEKRDVSTYFQETGKNTTFGSLIGKPDATPPNIIMIVVEGLGQTFLEGGLESGFTPFLDKLASKSLYFKNTISNTGRTFGVIPTLLGSLPYGSKGFLDFGPEFPKHHSLVEILKKNDYQTRFFYGGSANFDKQDLFFWHQGVDKIIEESQFPPKAVRMKPNKGGFSWGYPDHEVFDLMEKKTEKDPDQPFFDIVLTLSTHEPFQIPHRWHKSAFKKIIRDLKKDKALPPSFSDYENIFECIHYLDQSLKNWFNTMENAGKLENTLVIITGDHRLIPIPFNGPMDRMQVPLIMYHEDLPEPKTISSLNYHSDVFPSLLGWLKNQYELKAPDTIFAMTAGLDTTRMNTKSGALMVNKGDLSHFIQNNFLLFKQDLYKLNDDHAWVPWVNDADKQNLISFGEKFTKDMTYICEQDLIASKTSANWVFSKNELLFTFSDQEKKWIRENNINKYGLDSLFFFCRDLAFDKKYMESHAGLKHLLNKSPNYADPRILLGRSLAWQGAYEQAEAQLLKAIELSPNYYDGYSAIIDVYYWWGNTAKAKEYVDLGLSLFPDNPEIIEKKNKLLGS